MRTAHSNAQDSPIRPPRSVWVFALALSAPIASALATEIQVFTDKAHPVSVNTGFVLVELDAPVRLEVELATGLPATPQRATAILRQRLAQGGTEFQRKLTASYQGVATAWGLGIIKLPAVVVDRRFVVYGEPDVTKALSLIETYRRAHP